MLLRDLEDPFQGSFCINSSAKQLQDFEQLLLEDIAQAEEDLKLVGPTLLTLDRNRVRPNYNTGNTVYLHLLTGPLASNIRMLGDAFAWTWRKIKGGLTVLGSRTWKRGRKRAKPQSGIPVS